MCGGQSSEGVSANCFGYDFETDTWNMLGEMPEPKIASNNAYDVHWGIVMAGGQVRLSSGRINPMIPRAQCVINNIIPFCDM